jgi:hypothetical protein
MTPDAMTLYTAARLFAIFGGSLVVVFVGGFFFRRGFLDMLVWWAP